MIYQNFEHIIKIVLTKNFGGPNYLLNTTYLKNEQINQDIA